MNYLAHFLLSDPEPEALVGSMLADFSRGVDLEALPPRVQAAVQRHFRVDSFTDAHDVVRQSKNRIAPPHRRYAGVLVDVFYDHFLAVNWPRYSDVPFPRFVAGVYEGMLGYQAIMPERMQRTVIAMVSGDWLGSYRQVEGIETVLRRMSGRLTRVNDLATGGVALRASYGLLEEDFHRFFPELTDYANTSGGEKEKGGTR